MPAGYIIGGKLKKSLENVKKIVNNKLDFEKREFIVVMGGAFQ